MSWVLCWVSQCGLMVCGRWCADLARKQFTAVAAQLQNAEDEIAHVQDENSRLQQTLQMYEQRFTQLMNRQADAVTAGDIGVRSLRPPPLCIILCSRSCLNMHIKRRIHCPMGLHHRCCFLLYRPSRNYDMMAILCP